MAPRVLQRLTAEAHGVAVASEAEIEGTVDEMSTSEPAPVAAGDAVRDELAAIPLPLGDMPFVAAKARLLASLDHGRMRWRDAMLSCALML